jgi:hypothetical protein
VRQAGVGGGNIQAGLDAPVDELRPVAHEEQMSLDDADERPHVNW